MIRLACPKCKSMQQFGDDCAGKSVACPKCRQPVKVPPVVPVAPVAATPVAAVPARPASYTVPVRQEAPEFEVPSRANPILISAGVLAVVGAGVVYFMISGPDKPREVTPATPLLPMGKSKPGLVYTRDPEEVVKDLKAEDPGVRLQAVKELEVRGVGGQAAIKLLGGILKDTSKSDNVQLQTRRSAALALGKIGSNEEEQIRAGIVPLLQSVLADSDEGVRYAAVDGLGKLGGPAVETLLPLTDRFSGDKRFTMHVAEVLGNIGPPAKGALPTLQRLMAAAPQIHDGVRYASFIIQIDPRGPGTGPTLAKALAYNDEGVRRHALVLVTKMGNSARGLQARLSYISTNDINAELRDMAKQALDKMNPN